MNIVSLTKTRSRLRLITTVFYFISGIVTATWASRIPDIQQKFLLSDAAWGGVLFSLSIGLVAGLSMASWLVEKFGTFKIMLVTTVLYLALLCLLAIAPSVPLLIISLFLFGVVRNITNLANNTNAVEVQRLYKKPVMAKFHGVWSFACFGGAGVGTYFIGEGIVPIHHFIIVAVVSLMLIFVFRRRGNRQKSSGNGKRPLFIKPDRYLLLLGLISLCGMICESTMFDWSVNYFVKVLHVESGLVTAGYSAFIITMTTGRLLGDKLIAVVGDTRLLMINGIVIAAGFAVTAFIPTVIATIIGFMMVGAGMSIVVPMVFMLAGQSRKMNANYAIASVTLIGYIGFLSGPLLVGYITNTLGMQTAFGVVGVFGLGITMLAAILAKKRMTIADHPIKR